MELCFMCSCVYSANQRNSWIGWTPALRPFNLSCTSVVRSGSFHLIWRTRCHEKPGKEAWGWSHPSAQQAQVMKMFDHLCWSPRLHMKACCNCRVVHALLACVHGYPLAVSKIFPPKFTYKDVLSEAANYFKIHEVNRTFNHNMHFLHPRPPLAFLFVVIISHFILSLLCQWSPI